MEDQRSYATLLHDNYAVTSSAVSHWGKGRRVYLIMEKMRGEDQMRVEALLVYSKWLS